MLQRTLASALLSVACIVMSGCAHQQSSPHLQDPFEGLNRATFTFNKTVDKVAVKPVAYVYLKYTPPPLQVGITNFFDNLRELTNIANDLLQLKFAYAAHDTSRFLINTTLGIGGIFNPASTLGLEHRKEDFGQTLHHWGYHNSYYLVLPFLGPSTFRDTIGIAVDYYALSIWPWIESDWEKYALIGVDYLDIRARLLRKESVLDVLAVDEYTFVRDAYFQHREYLFNETSLNDGTVNTDDGFGDIKLTKSQPEKVATENKTEEVTPSSDVTKPEDVKKEASEIKPAEAATLPEANKESAKEPVKTPEASKENTKDALKTSVTKEKIIEKTPEIPKEVEKAAIKNQE
jgi:phospholipid-binding lipoprotein MlaA